MDSTVQARIIDATKQYFGTVDEDCANDAGRLVSVIDYYSKLAQGDETAMDVSFFSFFSI